MAETFDEKGLKLLYRSSRNAPLAYLSVAALFMEYTFEFHKILAAFWGGWACFLRGETRGLPAGVHIVVCCTMEQLVGILCNEIRFAFRKHVNSHLRMIQSVSSPRISFFSDPTPNISEDRWNL
jgi:hypothetical protein